MWRSLTALALVALAACAPALADTVTGGTAVPDPATVPSLEPTGGVVAGGPSGGIAPAPVPTPTPAPAPAPETPAPSPQPPDPVAIPALAPVGELRGDRRARATISLHLQEDEPLQDLPQVAPEAPPEPEPPDVGDTAPQEAAEPRLADTGLETLLLAYLGGAMLAVGLGAFAVLRKGRRLLEGGRG